jgi:hypothetical protein
LDEANTAKEGKIASLLRKWIIFILLKISHLHSGKRFEKLTTKGRKFRKIGVEIDETLPRDNTCDIFEVIPVFVANCPTCYS